MSDPRTISQLLKVAGYGHCRDEYSEKDSRHIVWRLDTGDKLGRFDALAAVRLVESHNRWTS